MSYSDRETSTDEACPVELYEFRRGTRVWRYTSAARDERFNAFVYSSIALKRGVIERSAQSGRAGFRVTLPRDVAVAQAFISTPPSEVTLLTVYRRHMDDSETVPVWMGRVLNAEWRGSEVEFNCEPVYTSLQRTGLRRLYQRNCPHALYGAACGASPTAHRIKGNVMAQEGPVIRVAAAADYADGYFAGGIATWSAEGLTEKRMIVGQSGDAITLSTTPPGLRVGAAVMLYPGCDHTLTTCDAKFSNSLNYGGFPFIPSKNPFGGSPIY
ncbi:phage BR0599 family protein [Hahella sp. HN01]|uniref:phage BR0599 family protein n=1 Tax=Hahella sp. HN01 TaxID=2847262 RepID=UPI001C1F032A|nr:phage BR0599 family protein [Hahella sp. HN01]MBU6956025.1 phage BR0599 family protein [Hahella sp. HN01]